MQTIGGCRKVITQVCQHYNITFTHLSHSNSSSYPVQAHLPSGNLSSFNAPMLVICWTHTDVHWCSSLYLQLSACWCETMQQHFYIHKDLSFHSCLHLWPPEPPWRYINTFIITTVIHINIMVFCLFLCQMIYT